MVSIRELQADNYKELIPFAIEGMHLYRFCKRGRRLELYGKYFVYMELCRATHTWGAYDEQGRFLGAMLVEMNGYERKQQPLGVRLYTAFWDFWQKLAGRQFVKEALGIYDHIGEQMLNAYQKKHPTDGEVLFLAAAPQAKGTGVGTAFLNKLDETFPGKEIYLYTDSNCTYQFYEHRGFVRCGEEEIPMKLADKSTSFTCFLFSKKLRAGKTGEFA